MKSRSRFIAVFWSLVYHCRWEVAAFQHFRTSHEAAPRIHGAVMMFFLTASCVFSEEKPSAELGAIREAYKAAIDNLVSGSGTGVYEFYTARASKETKMELRSKAKAYISFYHGNFRIRLDYEKDEIGHLESRVIVYDGTAILVNKVSKRIHPAHSEGEVYEAKPTRVLMRKAGFDFNPCALPAEILPVDKLPKYAKALTSKPDANMDYLSTFDVPPVVHCSFLASRKDGYNVIDYREYNTNHNNFQHVNLQATWERKEGLWYVKSIDRQRLSVDGSGQRIVFRYTTFEPNAEVSSSLFRFDSLDLAPNARVIDRRPNVEDRVLFQSRPSKAVDTELNTLVDKVKSLPHSPPPAPLVRRQASWTKYVLLINAILLCVIGLFFLWKRKTRGNIRPET